MRGWSLDPKARNDLRAMGIINYYDTGGTLLTAVVPLNEILLISAYKIGKKPVREAAKAEAGERKTCFKTGWLVWSELVT